MSDILTDAALNRLTRAAEALDNGDRATARAVLGEARGALNSDRSASNTFAVARLQSWLGRPADALEHALQAAILAPDFAPARALAGALLAELGRADEAVPHWEAAGALDAGQVDALYNAGQYRYNQGDYAAALAHWSKALQSAPGEVDLLKKVVQAQHALGQDGEADATFARLEAAWKASDDPRVQALDEVVIDQFKVGGVPVMASAALRPRSEDLHYAYTFRVYGDGGKIRLSVQLESSAYGRERGVPYLIGLSTPGGHRVIGPAFSEKPPYGELKRLVLPTISQALAAP